MGVGEGHGTDKDEGAKDKSMHLTKDTTPGKRSSLSLHTKGPRTHFLLC